MTRRVTLALGVGALLLAACATSPPDRPLAAQVEAVVAPLVEQREFSGAIVLMRGGQVVYARAFGLANHAAGLSFAPETPSDGGSVAKTLTAAGVMWLVQEGRLELDAPVVRYVPEYPHAQTTVRQLIAHANGLPPYYEFFDAHFRPGEVRTTEALLKIVARAEPQPRFDPGSRFEYSNLGYDVAALVIERVTGQAYEPFVKQRFFVPLGMTSAFARPARLDGDWPGGTRTLGYRWRAGAWQLRDVYDGEAFLGASNLYFSALDLARWGSANAAGTAVPREVSVAGQAAPRIGGWPSAINHLSWYCDERQQRCHYTGSLEAFHALVYWDRSRQAALGLVSNSSVPAWKLIALQRSLVAALEGRAPAAEPAETLVRIDKAARPALAGAYGAPGVATHVLAVDPAGQRMRLRIAAGPELDVFQVAREVLYVPALDCWIAFSAETQPPTMRVRSMDVDLRLQRAEP